MRRDDQDETPYDNQAAALRRFRPGPSWRRWPVGQHLGFPESEESAGVPGRHVTDRQKRLFMTLKKTHTIDVAAAKAGFSRATGYRLAEDPSLLSGKAAPRGRRRPDPLADIFETEVVPIPGEQSGASARWACSKR